MCSTFLSGEVTCKFIKIKSSLISLNKNSKVSKVVEASRETSSVRYMYLHFFPYSYAHKLRYSSESEDTHISSNFLLSIATSIV